MQKDTPNANAEGNPAAAPETKSESGDSLEELKKKAEERDLYRNELLRAKADLDNFQKRVRKERPAWEEHAVRRFLRDLLPVVDNLERALAHAGSESATEARLEEGVRLTHQLLRRVLADHGVEEIAAEDKAFDPGLHEAVSEIEVPDRPTGEVLEVLEKGYTHRDVVLRPSRVNVTRSPGETGQSVDSRAKEGEDLEK